LRGFIVVWIRVFITSPDLQVWAGMQLEHQIKTHLFLNDASSLATGNADGPLDIVPTERQQVFLYRHAGKVTHDASDSRLSPVSSA